MGVLVGNGLAKHRCSVLLETWQGRQLFIVAGDVPGATKKPLEIHHDSPRLPGHCMEPPSLDDEELLQSGGNVA